MSAGVTRLINCTIFECQVGPHRVRASLPERRCWLFLLLIRHSKGNTGISEFACCFCGFPGCLCLPKTQPPAGCLQPSRAHGPERKHAKPSAPCFSEPSGLNPFCMARRDAARKLGSLGPGGSGVTHTAQRSFSPFSVHLKSPWGPGNINLHLGFLSHVPVVDFFCNHKKNQ